MLSEHLSLLKLATISVLTTGGREVIAMIVVYQMLLNVDASFSSLQLPIHIY